MCVCVCVYVCVSAYLRVFVLVSVSILNVKHLWDALNFLCMRLPISSLAVYVAFEIPDLCTDIDMM